MCRIAGYAGHSPKDVSQLLSALKRSAQDDQIGGSRTHKDGWGYAIRSGGTTLTYKTDMPIYEDQHKLPDFGRGEIHAIFHARRVSSEFLRHRLSHPYTFPSPNSEVLCCHNAHTHVHLRRDRPIVRGALNMLSLSVNNQNGQASVSYLSVVRFKTERMQEYYRLFEQRLEGGVAVVSSTLALQEGIGGNPVRQGRFVRLSHD